MTSNQRLFAPLPPGVDPLSPEIQAWRQDRLETAVQDMSDQMGKQEPLPIKQLTGLALLIILGLAGRFAPDAMLSLAVKLLSQ